jgi:mono/diheme cytochrome c family protein
MLGAVNSCLTEWMNAEEWTEEDAHWTALYEFLDSMATVETADAITIQVVLPPTDLSGGDAAAGLELFNQSCSMCHGQDAMGTNLAPQLAGTQLPASYVATRIRTSGLPNSPVYEGLTGGIMPFWGQDRLSDDELRDIVQWVSTSEIDIPEPETLCDTYCGLAETNCTGENAIDWGDSDCQTLCAAYDMSGLNGDTSGDTVQCRIYHLGDPAGGEPAIHCPHGSPDGGGVCVVPPDPDLCGSDHPKVGQVAILQNHFHGIGGTATITDNCTIEVVDFDFDGNGINVQIYAAANGNYANGFSISPNLKNFPIGYNKASLTLDLGDHTLDEVDGISVWCVPVSVSFGDGLFE